MTFVPTDYCDGYSTITVTSDNASDIHLTGTYTITHISSVGVKYVNADKGTKITFSEKVNNIHEGHWRWAKDSPPYTLYYASPSTQPCVPSAGWYNLEEQLFSGNVRSSDNEYDLYIPCNLYNVYRRCDIVPTPTPGPPTATPVVTPTPTPTPILDNTSILYRNIHTELIWVKAKPTITYVNPVAINKAGGSTIISGLSMQYTEKVYARGVPWMFHNPLEMIDMFGDKPSMSADFPGFNGLELEFSIIDENHISVTIPELKTVGLLDIVILNRAGYGSLDPVYYTIESWTDYNLQNKYIAITD